MNCLSVILKPGVKFWGRNDLKQYMKRVLPRYSYEDFDMDLDLSPWSASLGEPFFQYESPDKIFLQISFYISDSHIYDKENYLKIKEFVKEICTALKTDEWWYSSEMQSDHYDKYSAIEIDKFISNNEHTLEYSNLENIDSYSGDEYWFIHDKA